MSHHKSALHHDPAEGQALVLDGINHFYEWNEIDNRWVKLHENDPDPPENLGPGQFDGQLVEVQL